MTPVVRILVPANAIVGKLDTPSSQRDFRFTAGSLTKYAMSSHTLLRELSILILGVFC